MTTVQKVIKYLAIVLAIFLIISIISAISAALFAVSGILGLKDDIEEKANKEMVITNLENDGIKILDIEIAFTNFTMKTGENLKIETNNNKINYKQENGTLKIKEEDQRWFANYAGTEFILYVPEGTNFEKVKISTGAGKIKIDNINTENMSFELGAGEAEIQTLNVSRQCEIQGGAGKLSILNGTINDMDLDMGVGEVNVTTSLIGKNEINAGIGSLNINLQGEKQSYKIKTDKGLGSIKIDGKEISDGEVFGDGENHIDVDGGIGDIKIEFE